MSDLDKAHKAIRAAAAKLEREGVDIDSICDALLVAGINGAVHIATKETIVSWLERCAALCTRWAESHRQAELTCLPLQTNP